MKIDALSEKLILYFVLLGTGAFMIVSFVTFYSTREAFMSRTFDQLTSLRVVKKNQINQFYADRIREIIFMADALNDAPEPSKLEKGIVESRFRYLSQYIRAFYIFPDHGVSIQGCFIDSGKTIPPSIPEKLLSTLNDKLIRQSFVVCDISVEEKTGEPFQLIAAKINETAVTKKAGKGILVLAVSMDAINAIMLNNDPFSGPGLSGETYLVGSDLLMRSTSRFDSNSINKKLVNTQPVLAVMKGHTGTIATSDYRNIKVLSSYSMIDVPGLKWAIIAEIDEKEAMEPIYETLAWVLLLSAIIMVIFFGFVLFISRRITKPLIRLRTAAVNLGKGQYDVALPVESHDEIGALTEAFNNMARQIHEKTTELQRERFGRIRSVFDGEEMERQRLSRELHDGIGQSLIAVKLRLENLLYQDGKDVRNSIQELKNYFDQIIDEVRRISNNLMPSVLEVFSIPIAFRNLFAETEEHSGLRIHFEAKGNFDDLDKKVKTYIYRLVQEALNNIVKHAEATEVGVNLTFHTNQLTLVIRDDGKGFSPESVGKDGGNGIHNMRERANLLQGHIEILSAPSQGTTITIKVPIITYVKNQDFPRG